jgi:hypothetical protein
MGLIEVAEFNSQRGPIHANFAGGSLPRAMSGVS